MSDGARPDGPEVVRDPGMGARVRPELDLPDDQGLVSVETRRARWRRRWWLPLALVVGALSLGASLALWWQLAAHQVGTWQLDHTQRVVTDQAHLLAITDGTAVTGALLVEAAEEVSFAHTDGVRVWASTVNGQRCRMLEVVDGRVVGTDGVVEGTACAVVKVTPSCCVPHPGAPPR